MPESFAETPDGLLLVASGHDPVLRWDGLAPVMETAGVVAPTQAPTLSASGAGAIVGTYFAFVRFVDRLDNFSNLSPISASLIATGSRGTVTNATNAMPIVVTTGAAHGLSSGATVSISGVGGNASANGLFTITVLSPTTFALDGSTGTAAYTSGGTWSSGVASLTYGNVAVPQEAKVVRRQILRNTDGEATTFYVDIDTTDLTSTSFTTTTSDSILSAGIAVPLLDSSGGELANIYGIPPNWKSVLAHHKDRMFAAVDREYHTGMVQTTFGSTLVKGIGTGFTSSMATRFLWVTGASQSYEIQSVDTLAQTLTLLTPYQDPSDLFAAFSIRPAPAEARLVYFSESGLPEAWPATNSFSIQEDNDYLTGLMPKGSFIYILENQHIYRFTYQTDPATDGGIFLAANRGCVNHRCWLLVDDIAYCLDEEGIHAFSGGEESDPVSDLVGDLFSTTSPSETFRINWAAREQFHAMHFQPDATMRWFVCLDGHWIPRHAICFNYRRKRWWIEEFSVPIGASAVGQLRRSVPQMLLGIAGNILAYGAGNLDGPDPTAGTTQGNVSSAGFCSLTDNSASFAATNIIGGPVAITAGLGKGQVRIVSGVSGQTLTVNQPWLTKPDPTSKYQLGGVRWRFRSGWWRWLPTEMNMTRRVEVVFQPLPNPATFDTRLNLDFTPAPYKWGVDQSSAQHNGVASQKGSADLVCDLTWKYGLIQQRFDSAKEIFLDGKRWVQVELEGFSGQDQIRIYEVTLDGALGRQS